EPGKAGHLRAADDGICNSGRNVADPAKSNISPMRQSLSPGDGRRGPPSPYRLPLKLAVKETDDVASLLILFDATFDQFAGMNDGAMVLTAKCVTNVAEGAIGQLPREEHGYLPGKRDVCGTSLASHVREAHIEMLGNLAL